MNVFHYKSGGAACTRTIGAASVSFVAGDFTVTDCYVRLQVLDNPVYVTYDTTVPSASNGELLSVGDRAVVLMADLLRMKFIRQGANARVFAQPCKLVDVGIATLL